MPLVGRAGHVCHANNNNYCNEWDNGYLIFQSPSARTFVTLNDAKDACECCSDIVDKELRAACYNQFGVDGVMVEKYLVHLERMERMYHKKQEKKKKKQARRKFNPMFFLDNDLD